MESLISHRSAKSAHAAWRGENDWLVKISSKGLGWPGLRLESAITRGILIEDVVFAGHLIVMNLSPVALRMKPRIGNQPIDVYMPPLAICIVPKGVPYSLRLSPDNHCYWVGALVDSAYLDAAMQQRCELGVHPAVEDEVLAHLMRALLANLYHRDSSCAELDRALIDAFVRALGARYARATPVAQAAQGLGPQELQRLRAWLDAHLHERFDTGDLAAQIGIAASRFAREYKRAVGVSPWKHVTQLRLDRACGLMRDGHGLATVAARCGFADQFHLSRVFKRRFGVPPSRFQDLGRRN